MVYFLQLFNSVNNSFTLMSPFIVDFLPKIQVKNGSIICKGLAPEAKKFLTEPFLISFEVFLAQKKLCRYKYKKIF